MPRFRIFCGDEVALGPGKVELLRAIADTGSIRKAALRAKMSYMRAWSLIRTMNQCFKEPLVQANRGGLNQGAFLTDLGRTALDLYEKLEAETKAVTAPFERDFKKLLKRRPSSK